MQSVGLIYNSFYDTDLIEYSVASLEGVVSYVVVVHQEVGLNGDFAPSGSLKTLHNLKDRGIINELILINKDTLPKKSIDAIITKRNLGLSAIKKQGIDWVMPMDADEFYDNSIADVIKCCADNKLETIYSPIVAYYGDVNHSFIDTYNVPSVYKVNDRWFKRINSSVLCDPARKMKEGRFNDNGTYASMHHLTYMPQRYYQKRSGLRNTHMSFEYKKVRNHLKDWKAGDKALVFSNKPDGSNFIVERELDYQQVSFFDGLNIPKELLK